MTGVEALVPFAIFAFVSAATPGPNNLLLLTSGQRVGLWRSMPFIFGISVGFSTLLVGTGYGLGQIFERFPFVHLSLKIIGTLYFLFLAWTLLRSSTSRKPEKTRDLGFWTGVFFQAVNPKGWLMAITAVALFLPQTWTLTTITLMAGIFIIVGLPANMAWAGAGQLLKPLVAKPDRMRLFNVAMAALLVLSILPVWIPIQ